ncbi:MAG: BrnT family toxin [Candidatus Omnitrophica bacterium]|nr:BrnT family toxin [Candidatus Omnitrophota bacterium]
MDDIRFEWDRTKAALNKRRHGVTFEEAQTVFYDEYAIEFFDLDHSEREDRFVMLGMSFRLRLLVVCHCVREVQSIIRIISARKATHREAEQYRRERT